MIYEEYEAMLSKIRKLEKELMELNNRKEDLFYQTQPKSSPTDKIIVDGHNPINTMEKYVIEKEYLTERINQLNELLDYRYPALNRKREELKLSKNLYDRIYYYRFIERLSVFKIGLLIGYSKEQTYRYLKKLKMTQNDTKVGVIWYCDKLKS